MGFAISIDNTLLNYIEEPGVVDVVIPDEVKEIGSKAFMNCTSIQSVVIPDSVRTIDSYAFSGCQNLKSITLPARMKKIGIFAFYGCENLETIVIPRGIKRIDNCAFKKCTNLRSITIPLSVTQINIGAFEECTSLQSIAIPIAVTSIGAHAFQGCTNLESVTIPDGVTVIEDNTFCDCTSLKSIILPYDITRIGDYAFYKCTKLQSVTVPQNIKFIGKNAFDDHIIQFLAPDINISKFSATFKTKLVSYFIKNEDKYPEDIKEEYLSYIRKQAKKIITFAIEKNDMELLHYLRKEKILTIKNIDEYIVLAEKKGNIEIIAILLDYKNSVFSSDQIDKEERRRIKAELNFNATEAKKKWKYTKKDNGTIRIDYYKGTNTEIHIPAFVGKDTVTEIGAYAFSIHRSRTTFEQRMMLCAITKIYIPDNVTTISYCAFYDCKNLNSVYIPDSVTKIEEWAFACNQNLQSITIPDSVTEIANSAFNKCKNLVISAPSGSYAIEYAKFRNIKFIET